MSHKFVGAHTSAAGGVFNAPLNAMKIGAKAFALFTKNQRQWAAKPLDSETIDKFKENLELSGILPKHVLSHDSYLINLGHPEMEKRDKSYNAFVDEVERCMLLGLDRLNFHPGSHLKKITEDACLDAIAEKRKRTLDVTAGVGLDFENTAGQESNLGWDFEDHAYILAKEGNKYRCGVCMDTFDCFRAGMTLW